jgi:hypothetical protein
MLPLAGGRGNEKASLSLRLSGYYTQQFLYWNDGVDGVEDSIYLSGLGQKG